MLLNEYTIEIDSISVVLVSACDSKKKIEIYYLILQLRIMRYVALQHQYDVHNDYQSVHSLKFNLFPKWLAKCSWFSIKMS